MHNIFHYLDLIWQLLIAYVSLGFIISGLLFIISGIIGILRFKDFFARAHASGIIDSCAVPMIIAGIAIRQQQLENCVKLIVLALIILLVSPLNTHILAKAAYVSKK